MRPAVLFAPLVLTLAAPAAHAQSTEWKPPSREMPAMPRVAEIRSNWLGPRAAWFRGTEAVTGVEASALRASGQPKPGADYVVVARFSQGAVPAVVWSDRNGDGRADMIELLRSGGVIVQLIDADYDGSANVLRVYDASGSLVRQERM